MFTLVRYDGQVISEHLNRQAAYNAMLDALEKKVPCHIEYTCGQSTELVKACRQKRAAAAYIKNTVKDYSKKEPITIIRNGNKYIVPVEMLKNSGELKKSAISAINKYFENLAAVAVTN